MYQINDWTYINTRECWTLQTVLAGSYDDCVYIYSVDYGRALGKVLGHMWKAFFLT